MVPHVRDRPLNLWRWNRGIDEELRRPAGDPEGGAGVGAAGDGAARQRGRGDPRGRRRGGDAGLAREPELHHPPHLDGACRPARSSDRLVFDFDPPDDGDGHLEAIRAGALAVGDLLRENGLTPYAMTSGSRGIHVVAPLRRGPQSDRVAPWPASSPRRWPIGCRTSSRRRGARRGAAGACWWTRRATPTPRPRWRRTPCAPSRARRWRRRCSGTRFGCRSAPSGVDAARRAERLEARGDPWEGIGSAAAGLPRL